MHYVYVLHSPSFNKIYVGETTDYNGRLQAHNHPQSKGWTKKFQPWIIIHVEEVATRSEALTREKQLKSFKGREWIRKTLLM
ncbi:MAG: GIY-YIG nuclease family protein [Bacteroidota bacterium]